MRATGNESGNVRNVKHHQCTNFIGDRAEWLWLKTTWVRRGSRNNHFWLVFDCKLTNLIKVQALICCTNTERMEVVQNS